MFIVVNTIIGVYNSLQWNKLALLGYSLQASVDRSFQARETIKELCQECFAFKWLLSFTIIINNR